jgi:WxcM-like, C-terminal
LHQLLVALSGSFDVHIDNGRDRRSFHLNRAYNGLYIPPMNWREIDNFSGGSVCLALASARFDESDYIRDFVAYGHAARAIVAG